MDLGGSDAARGRSAVQAVLLGLCAGALFWTFYRVVTVKFPLNFVSPIYATIPLFGIPFGLAWARRTPALTVRTALWLGAGITLFAVSALAYKDKSVHYLLFGSYYDYPAPTSAWVTRGLIASIPLSTLPFIVFSRSFALLPAAARRLATPALLLGIGGGVLLAELLTPSAGAYAIFIAACASGAIFLPDRRVGVVTAALVVLAGALMYHPLEAIFTWQLKEYTRLDTYWTHHYKVDWIGFDDGHCLGAVRNEIMIGYSCDVPEKLELTHLKMADVISNGPIRRERVASIGRPDGVIAAAHKAKNPNLKRFVAVENDERVVRDMLTRYSHQQGDIFTTQPGIELVGGDERLWLERTQEKFDAVYLDGIGLMLVPFPFTVIQHENYLFSSDAYRRIFDDLLTPDGVLIIDRGTTHNGESQDLAAALPEGVQVRTLFTKVPTYPLTGLPLVYIIASRNGAELDRIARELRKGNLYGQDTYEPAESRRRWSSDDRPMYQPKAIHGMFAVMAPVALVTVALVLWALKKQVGAWTGRDVRSQLSLGILFAVSAIWLTARAARAFVAGTQMGFAYSFATLFAGVACGLVLGRDRPQRTCVWAALAACAAGFGIQIASPFAPWAALLASSSGGLGLGALAAMARPSTRSAPEGFELVLGVLLGVYIFQVGLFLVGFKLLAGCVLAGIAVRGLYSRPLSLASRASVPPTGFVPDAAPVGERF
jgi:spermidine synthase